jgi:hypothetical protein
MNIGHTLSQSARTFPDRPAIAYGFRLHPKEFAFIIDHSEAKAVIVSPDFNEPL